MEQKFRILVMGSRKDEIPIFEEVNSRYGFAITYVPQNPSLENAGLAIGFRAVTMNGGSLSGEVLRRMSENGVRYLAARSVGTDNIEIPSLRKYGMKAANVKAYSPNAISEHAVLLMLATLRKFKEQQKRIAERNFLLNGLRGKELRDMTVGVIGTGRIGTAVAGNLSGFGCGILAFGHHSNPEIEKFAKAVPLGELLENSDIVTLHCPMRAENFHLLNARTIAQMKDGAVLVNTARGELVDTQAVYEALQSGKLGGFAMDVYENDGAFLRRDCRGGTGGDELFSRLTALSNVLYTTHIAFDTDHALKNIVETSLSNLYEFLTTDRCENDISAD